jgi:DNA-binding protein HU-beta
MNKSQLIEQIALSSDLSKKEVGKFLDSFVEGVKGALKSGDKIQLLGFGTFKINKRSARKGRNPQTGAEIDIAASNLPSWKSSKGLLD